MTSRSWVTRSSWRTSNGHSERASASPWSRSQGRSWTAQSASAVESKDVKRERHVRSVNTTLLAGGAIEPRWEADDPRARSTRHRRSPRGFSPDADRDQLGSIEWPLRTTSVLREHLVDSPSQAKPLWTKSRVRNRRVRNREVASSNLVAPTDPGHHNCRLKIYTLPT
jgi:hypothetical protein